MPPAPGMIPSRSSGSPSEAPAGAGNSKAAGARCHAVGNYCARAQRAGRQQAGAAGQQAQHALSDRLTDHPACL